MQIVHTLRPCIPYKRTAGLTQKQHRPLYKCILHFPQFSLNVSLSIYLSVDLSHYLFIHLYSYNNFYLSVIPLLSFYIILLFAPCVTPTAKFLSLLHLFVHMIGCRCCTAIFYSYGYVNLVYSYSPRSKA